MGLPDAVRAMRHSVAVSRLDDVRYLRLSGDGAWDALDHLFAGDLYVRDGQLRHGLLLDDDAHPFADCYAGRDDEEYFLLAEGPSAGALTAHVARHLPPGAQVACEDLTGTVGVLGLDGPYAWELLASIAGAECIGLPYLTFFHFDEWIICRAGNTGEFGYDLIVPRPQLDELERTLLASGAALDAAPGGRDALEQCALENGFFNIRREGRGDVTPLELQLQWRVSPSKTFVGVDALRRRRQEGLRRRLTTLVGPGPFAVGDELLLEGSPAGAIVNAGASEARGDWVALALVDIAWAHPGIAFAAAHAGVAVPARSVSPPVLDNRSLHVSPQLHSYATRRDYVFPPLSRTSP
jgi:glycine cleavage system aminomethyltransferase T